MALSAGSLGLRLEVVGSSLDWLWSRRAGGFLSLSEVAVGQRRNQQWIGPAVTLGSNREATNGELGTGID